MLCLWLFVLGHFLPVPHQHLGVFRLTNLYIFKEARFRLVPGDWHYADRREALAVQIRGEASSCRMRGYKLPFLIGCSLSPAAPCNGFQHRVVNPRPLAHRLDVVIEFLVTDNERELPTVAIPDASKNRVYGNFHGIVCLLLANSNHGFADMLTL